MPILSVISCSPYTRLCLYSLLPAQADEQEHVSQLLCPHFLLQIWDGDDFNLLYLHMHANLIHYLLFLSELFISLPSEISINVMKSILINNVVHNNGVHKNVTFYASELVLTFTQYILNKSITWDFYSPLLHVYNRADIYHCPVMETLTAICADSSWYKTNIKFL